MPKRYKKYRARRNVEVYEKPYRGAHITLSCQASGIVHRESNADDLPSVPITMGINSRKKQTATIDVSAEMRRREKVAQEEAERRKKMIAPMYNKGAYQYIGGVDETILHDIGKKK